MKYFVNLMNMKRVHETHLRPIHYRVTFPTVKFDIFYSSLSSVNIETYNIRFFLHRPRRGVSLYMSDNINYFAVTYIAIHYCTKFKVHFTKAHF